MRIDNVKNHSRTTNTILNFFSSIGGQLIVMAMSFIVRTFFIRYLGKSYLGISGLFSNILSLLSLAELGVGSAILFKLYEPIAHEDHRRVAVLIHFYKTVYRMIGIVVAVVGACLIPFLPRLIKDYNTIVDLGINPVFIYLLYLLNSVASYLFLAYKSAIIKANQKEYVINLVSYVITITKGIAQIVGLIIWHNFELYVFISIGFVILQNVVFAIIAKRMYPYIDSKYKDRISKEETIGVLKDCGALFLYKLNTVVLKSTDNIVLSVFLGLDSVALYSNYYIFYNTIQTLFSKIYNSVSHSLGNLHTTHNLKQEYLVFKTINLITVMLGGTAFVGIWVVGDAFISQWVGSSWVIPQPFSFIFGLELFTLAIRTALGKYRATMGLFQQAKYRPLFAVLINIILSVLFVKVWGITGVILATVIADWATFMWFDPVIIHKHGFENQFPVRNYYLTNGKYLLIICTVGFLDFLICQRLLAGHGWISVILSAVVCGVSVPAALFAFERKSEQGKRVLRIVQKYTKRVKNLHS